MSVELMAPAKNMEGLVDAINSGADSVYFGLKKFNARNVIENFSLEEMCDAIRYAHNLGKKAYLTLNTLVKDEEFDEAIEYAKIAINAGIDAIIIQDIGIYRELSLYDVPLIASTQMTICNRRGVLVAKEMGFKRVVLARELNINEIETIANDTEGIELECFIHGGLCIAYSGQCHVSSVFHHKAANRGICQTPCWDDYTLYCENQAVDGGKIIKPNDMYGIHHIPILSRAGIAALKIQGRTRNVAYIKTVVSLYRKYIDKLDEMDDFEPTHEEKELLKTQSPRGLMRGNLDLSVNREFVIQSDYKYCPKIDYYEKYTENQCAELKKISIRLNDLSNIDVAFLSRNISRIYLSYDLFVPLNYDAIVSLKSIAPVYLVMPTLIERYDVSITEVAELVKKYNVDGLSLSNIGDLIYTKYIPCDFVVERSFNVCNQNSVDFLRTCGISCISLPFELTPEECKRISESTNFTCERTVYGRPILMQMKYCLISRSNECPEQCNRCHGNKKYTLVGEECAFLVCTNRNRTETTLFPQKKIALPVFENDVDFCRFEFTDESTLKINAIIDMYLHGRYPCGDYINDLGSI